MEARRLGPARRPLAARSPPLAQGIRQAPRDSMRTSPAFTDEDLRYRQLARRRQPALRAAVFFLLDVSGSMSDRDRQLAKTFFFWVAAGLKREYKALDIAFVAHTTEAWEFSEPDFFKVTGTGGTVASVGLAKVHEIMERAVRPRPSATSTSSTRPTATTPRTTAPRRVPRSMKIAQVARYAGYVEISTGVRSSLSEISSLFQSAIDDGLPVQPLLHRRPG